MEQVLETLQTSDEESDYEKCIKMKMVHHLVDKELHECNSEKDMANQVVNSLITGVVKLILPLLYCVVPRPSDVLE
jgi:hypothetical protein